MSKLKHTPGPWEKDHGNTIHHIKSVQGESNSPTVCRYNDQYRDGGNMIVADSLSDEEKEANGLLIAAAPEMLEALIFAYKSHVKACFDVCSNKDCSNCIHSENETKLRLAIEKATGLSIKEHIQ